MVFGISIGVWGILGILLLSSRKEQGSMLRRVSIRIYKMLAVMGYGRKGSRHREGQILHSLTALYPGESQIQLLTEYYAGKISLVLLILLLGSILACGTEIAGKTNALQMSDGTISRSEEKQTVTLEAVIDFDGEMHRGEITLDINERILTNEEAKDCYQELIRKLDVMILGENVSLQEIRTDLNLPDMVEGFPFSIFWKSSNRMILADDGTVYEEDLEAAEQVSLTAEVFYQGNEWVYSWTLTVCPPERTEWEQLVYDLSRLSEKAEKEQKYEEIFSLPQAIEGSDIVWSVEAEGSGIYILGLTFAAAIIVYYMKDKDLQGELVKRRTKIRAEYPNVVGKYALFLEAGMTVRGAFIKICEDYYERKRGKMHPLYEEMRYACNELKAGVSESRVYEEFGKRTGLQEYTRLCALLNQNIKKGNTSLAKRLREESDEALRENLQLLKKQGEEAETKLLAPMGMMLIMILLIVILPAFSGMGI